MWDIPGRLWALGRKVEELLGVQARNDAAVAKLDVRLRAAEDRLIRLESHQDHLITEAKAAAAAAARVVAAGMMAEAVTRLTRAEIRLESVERGRLPPPPGG